MKDFYDRQDDLTKAKIEFYRNYIETYLIKILMGFKECIIFDLFCGPGTNGSENGSPLILIERANYILKSKSLDRVKLYILFNDINKIHIQNLQEKLEKIKIDSRLSILPVENKTFEDIYTNIVEKYKNSSIPKFFFLDPFKYSNIKIKHLKGLINLRNSEILLFLPVFFTYRFKNTDFDSEHKVITFLNEYTLKGSYNYKDINEFMNSIRDKLKERLDLDFVRPILLDYGTRKNSLFLLTKSKVGMLVMNKLFLKKTLDGKRVQIKSINQKQLFGVEDLNEYIKFAKELEKNLRKKTMSSTEIIFYTIQNGFLPKHARSILKKLKDSGKIEIFDQNNNPTPQYYIAEKPKGNSIFKYVV